MIEIKNLTKIFKNNKGIINASFNVNNGIICGIVGDNGAGKSTLIKTIFDEYKKDSGTVLYNKEDIYKTGIMKKFSLFPDQSIFPFHISLIDFAIYAATLSGEKSKNAKTKALNIFESVNLKGYENKTFSSLSAGMQKRALLAISLITNPEVIVFDKPTANLDVKTRIQFLDLLKELKNICKTIIITTHLIDELQAIADQIVIIEEGHIIYSEKVTKSMDIKQIYKNITKQEQMIDILKIKATQTNQRKENDYE